MSIILSFKNSTIALTGNLYGKRIFDEQVRPQLKNLDEPVTIRFPDQISFITASFVQGFFDFWLRTMSSDEIRKKITIEAGNERVKDYVWSNLEWSDLVIGETWKKKEKGLVLDWLQEIIDNPEEWKMFYSDSEVKLLAEKAKEMIIR